MHPLIGIPCRAGVRGKTNRPIYYSNQAYIRAIEDAGGIPVLIPIMRNFESLTTLLSRLDGLMLSGGIDIHPSNYREEPRPTLRETDIQLDELELALVNWALQEDVPMLGICRGLQMINVALGGTLYQDLATERPGGFQHANWDLPPREIVDYLQIEPGSRVEKLLGARKVAINSLHHQAIKEPGKGIVVSGRSEDSVVECIEVPQSRFMIAVQCHPEELYNEQPIWRKFFQAFVDVCTDSEG